jgi:hypothetical protein
MENIINVNALREALASGMSSATIHDWVDDTIVAMGYFNQYYGNNYVAVSKENIEKVQRELDRLECKVCQMCFKYMYKSRPSGFQRVY